MKAAELAERFQQQFHNRPQVFSAPGRVNLIGEHTDYNDGFVLPSAIGFYTHAAISPRPDRRLAIRSTEFRESFESEVTSLPKTKQGAWYDYVIGVAQELIRAGCRLTGADLLVNGEVPIGSGLSSSAALEVAGALAFFESQQRRTSAQADSPALPKSRERFHWCACGNYGPICFLPRTGRFRRASRLPLTGV
jgi:galactokinase